MTGNRSRVVWGVAAVAFAAALALAGYAVTTGGVSAPSGPDVDPGDMGDPPPEAQVEFRPNPGSMTVLYEGGDAVVGDNVYLVVEGEPRVSWTRADLDVESNDPLTAGEKTSLPSWSDGETVRVVWVDGDDSKVLAEYEP